jgi:iron(II)-dependent oxidoreductase
VSKSVEWVAIAGGSFTMGSAGGESNEQPPHTVSVGDFEIGRTEVTVAEYGRCVALGVCTAPDTGSAANWNVNNRDLFPVNYVSWQQAADFCAWAGGRLPTEAEWEFAARSRGVTTAYPWGEEPATCDYAVMDDGGAGCGSGSSRAVCSREAGNTAEGLCDMAGNGREWVQDLYHLTYDGAPADGSAWEVNGTLRVVRGGSYDLAADDLRASARMGYHPVLQAATVSFRCARDAS